MSRQKVHQGEFPLISNGVTPLESPQRPAPHLFPTPPSSPKPHLTIVPPRTPPRVSPPKPTLSPKPKLGRAIQYEFSQVQEKVSTIREKTKSEEEFLKDYWQMQGEIRKVLRKNVPLHAMLQCPIGNMYFMRFLEEEFASENLISFLEVQDLLHVLNDQRMTPFDEIKTRVTTFYTKFISEQAEYGINLPGSMRESLEKSFQVLNTLESPENQEVWRKDLFVSLTSLFGTLTANLSDPYFRFFASDYLLQVSLFIFSHDLKQKQQELINAGKNDKIVMNNILKWELKVDHPCVVVEAILKRMIEMITDESCWEDGEFDYELIPVKMFSQLQQEICKLQVVDLTLCSSIELLCFWINTYNLGLLNASLMSRGLPATLMNRTVLEKKTNLNIGGNLYSLYTIFNQILTENKPYTPDPKWSKFAKTPEIMFALIDVSLQSPPLHIYYPNGYDTQIYNQTSKYIKHYTKLDHDKQVIRAPSILFTNKNVFRVKGQNLEGVMKNFIYRYLTIPKTFKVIPLHHDYETNYSCVKQSVIRQVEHVSPEDSNPISPITSQNLPSLQDWRSLSQDQIKDWVSQVFRVVFNGKKVVASHVLVMWLIESSQGCLDRKGALEFIQTVLVDASLVFLNESEVLDDSNQFLLLREDIEDIYGQEIIKSGVLFKKCEPLQVRFEKMNVTLYQNALTIIQDGKLETSLLLYRPIQIRLVVKSETDFDVDITPYSFINFKCLEKQDQKEWIDAFMKLDVFVIDE